MKSLLNICFIYQNFWLSRRDVMVVGDLNVSHKRIDHCDPDDVSCFMFLFVFLNIVGPL